MGYDPKSGVWRVQETNRGKPTVKRDGGNITGTQGRNVTVTGKYGEKVNLNTSVNQTASTGKIQTAFAAAGIGSSAVRAVEDDGGRFSTHFSNGEYGKAAMAAARAVGNFFDGFFTGGLGGYIAEKFEGDNVFNHYKYEELANSAQAMYNYAKDLQAAQAQAEREGKLAEALAAAQAQKIAQEAAESANREQKQQEAVKKQAEGKTIWVLKFSYIADGKSSPEYSLLYTEQLPTDTSVSLTYSEGNLYSYSQPQSSLNRFAPKKIPDKSFAIGFLTFEKWEGQKYPELPFDTTKLPLTESEIADILRRMLESNQTNHAELMRQLSMMGNVVSESTTNITYNQTTAKSAPYTPQGSNQAQQTQATVHPDGSVTTSIIPRPDLKPDSSQAPTRQPVTPETPSQPSTPQNPDGQQQNPNGQSQNQQDKDFCDKHSDSLMCADAGNADYEDVAIPHQDIPLDFSPADIFATDGVCPEPRYVDLGIYGKHEFSYDGICEFARKLRPLFILSTILACAYFIYASLDR